MTNLDNIITILVLRQHANRLQNLFHDNLLSVRIITVLQHPLRQKQQRSADKPVFTSSINTWESQNEGLAEPV